MKRALLTALIISAFPLSAQQVAKPAAMRANEHREVTSASASLLAGALNFRPDGTAHATHKVGNFSTRVELKDLSLQEIIKQPVTKEDQAKGITRRYHAKLVCRAHRIWEGSQARWSEWRSSSYGFFPSTIVVEEVNGKLVASARRLTDFSPGTDGAMTVSTR
ncbi:hypothetical protein OKA04_19610 [Luteolibacter flavescens]|uniref:CNP1-like uncharacterized domain-containing protein n=1 Tax=Luteolibacter flavescens TaxID=1859460 RepID=A0ABT3FUP9_9BACT|nr:hypothetical protein [Luteolibacter flavescens]MCW1886956.1 hypothetical protein [Luteolibacter flavescens]